MRSAPLRPISHAGGRVAALTGAALLLLAACSGSGQAPPRQAASGSPGPAGSRYVSFTSYPGWIQASIPPGKFNYAPWTIINDFGLWPTRTGGIAVGDMESLAYIPRDVTAAHAAGRKIIMAVGEQGLGAAFASAASGRYRDRLVRAIVADVTRYRFDGVDVDWEEEVPAHRAEYVALVRDLRAAMTRAFPGRHMYLSADVNPGQVPPAIAVQIAPYVDSLNVESFQDNGVSSVAAYTRAGIPAGKLLLGIGIAKGYYDTTRARVAAKVRFVEQHGLKGTLLWQPGNLHSYRTDPRLIPLRQMLDIPR